MILKNLEVKTFPCNKDKSPATKNGFKDATFEYEPNDVYGIACGGATDIDGNDKYLLVIDVDVRSGGLKNWGIVKLGFQNKYLDTYTVETPSGGLHIYYYTDLEINIKKTLKKGIDLKYTGGYVIGANSVSSAGKYRVINNSNIQPLPNQLFKFMNKVFENGTNNEDSIFEEYDFSHQEKENILNGLIENREWDSHYDMRYSILNAMKKTGFDIQDFLNIIVGSNTDKVEKDWETSWRSVSGEALPSDYFTLFKYSKVFIDIFYQDDSLNRSNDLLFLAFFIKRKKILQQFVNKPTYILRKFFSNKNYTDIALLAIEEYVRTRKAPTVDSLKYLYVQKKERDESFPSYIYTHILNSINELSLNDWDEETVLQDMIDRFNYIYMSSYVNDVNKDRTLSNEEKIKKLASIRPFTVEEKKLGLALDDFEKIEKLFQDADTKVIPTSFPDFDMLFNGGFNSKELTIFGGASGTGKTLVMGDLALKAFMENKTVIYFSFEVKEESLVERFYSNISKVGLNKKDFILNFDTPKNSFITNTTGKTGKLFIVERNSREVSPLDIKTIIEEHAEEGFKADIIFVDYIGIMASDDTRISPENTNQYQKSIAEELRNIAKDLDIPVVSAVQLNREAMGKSGGTVAETGMKTMADSIGVAHTADNIVMLIQTPEQKKRNQLFFKAEKNRMGVAGKTFLAEINYSAQRIESVRLV